MAYVQLYTYLCTVATLQLSVLIHLSVRLSVCLFVHCCIYSRRKGKGKREESQDVTEPEIPAIKKWLVGDCPT